LRNRPRGGMGAVFGSLAMVALLAVTGASVYFAYSTLGNGGAPHTGFEVALTTSTTHVDVPKGDVLVVIPPGITASSKVTFQPQNVKLVLGVNSTVFFDNQDTTEHIIESTQWPAGTPGFTLWLVQGQTGTIKFNSTGYYAMNFELVAASQNFTATVVSA
jgi:hypothetical protein